MRIITTRCEDCETIVAGNILERKRRLKCPRIVCENELSFYDLPPNEQSYLEENNQNYRLD